MGADEHRVAADPARAFDGLRDEVSRMRGAMEALSRACEANQPPDYTSSLATMAKELTAVASQLDGLRKHPAFAMTPEEHQQAVARAGNGLMRETLQRLDRATEDAEEERQWHAEMIGTARKRSRQSAWLLGTGIVAVLIGLLGSPYAARGLPFGWNGRVAALIMNNDRWLAGAALMQAYSPDRWGIMVDADKLVQANQEILSACRVAAARAGSEQRCTITVAPPSRTN